MYCTRSDAKERFGFQRTNSYSCPSPSCVLSLLHAREDVGLMVEEHEESKTLEDPCIVVCASGEVCNVSGRRHVDCTSEQSQVFLDAATIHHAKGCTPL